MSKLLCDGNRRRGDVSDLRDVELGSGASESGCDALGEYFVQNRSWLRPTANRLGSGLIDGEDLLGEVLVAVIDKLVGGTGQIDNVGPYLVQAMRNRVKDELRSPRSRVVGLQETEELRQDDPAALHRVEVDHELRTVRSAFARLDPAEQRALSAVAVDGVKPRDLERELRCRPEEIYALLYRAKAKLRRAILQETLFAESQDAECRRVSAALPARLPGDLRRLRGLEPIASHLDQCPSCARAWEQYVHMTQLAA